MSNSQTQSVSVGPGVLGLTFIVLLVLKLTGLAAISWWWVFAPLIVGFVLFLAVLAFILVVAFLTK